MVTGAKADRSARGGLGLALGALSTALGWVEIVSDGEAIVQIAFTGKRRPKISNPDALVKDAQRQLVEYFAARRRDFELPLNPAGSAFQKQVWCELSKIPYGSTTSYSALAACLGRPLAARAVGQACHSNPIAIVIPCHRVIGKNGALTGYAGGLEYKSFLLELEAGAIQQS